MKDPRSDESVYEFVQPTPESISISNLKSTVRRSHTATFIEWSENKERRKILCKSLKLLKFDLEVDGRDFKIAPAHLPQKAAILEFTEAGIKRLSNTVGEMVPYPRLLSLLQS
jgi:hypothetical protein